MKEKDMWVKLKEYFLEDEIFLQRIESGSTGLGIPDIYFVTKNKIGWIELKEIKYWPLSMNSDIFIDFRLGQIAWIKRHLHYNDSIYLLTTVKGIKNSWSLFKGINIKENYLKFNYFNLSIKGQNCIHNIGLEDLFL